jgi:hypothetical protein
MTNNLGLSPHCAGARGNFELQCDQVPWERGIRRWTLQRFYGSTACEKGLYLIKSGWYALPARRVQTEYIEGMHCVTSLYWIGLSLLIPAEQVLNPYKQEGET